jgi:hypothetical protein
MDVICAFDKFDKFDNGAVGGLPLLSCSFERQPAAAGVVDNCSCHGSPQSPPVFLASQHPSTVPGLLSNVGPLCPSTIPWLYCSHDIL